MQHDGWYNSLGNWRNRFLKKEMICWKPLKFCMQIFWHRWRNETIEQSIRKQMVRTVMKSGSYVCYHQANAIERRYGLFGLGGFLWIVKIANWDVNNWTVRICYKFNDDSEKGGWNCEPTSWFWWILLQINIRGE